MEKYNRGFTVNGNQPFMTEEWLYQKDKSNGDKLVFYGYDANLCAMTSFSSWPRTEWKANVINRALEFTKDFDGEVWLDDVRIKTKKRLKARQLISQKTKSIKESLPCLTTIKQCLTLIIIYLST
ncbi:hypothetical protein [Enterococcus sp.]|uniref:hypothetical protein n=1 Tax=Enterococcus sp. TaxID=35783 RepID=UPI002FC86FB7